MTVANRTTLKGYFQTGDKPTQSNFEDLIDSSLNPDGITIGFAMNNAGAVIDTGTLGFARVAKSGTITAWTMRSDLNTTTTVTIKKCAAASFPTTSSIVASAKPTLTAQTSNTSSTLTGWTTTVTEGDYIEYNVDTNNNAASLALELTMTVP